MINTMEIKLNDIEYKRYYEFITEHLMKVARPFVFKDVDGKFYAINHGLNDGRLLNTTVDGVRKYAEAHSNITDNDKLNIICCFGAGITETTDNTEIFIKSEYPVLISADPETKSAIFGILENDDDIPELIEIVKNAAGRTITTEDCKLKKGNA